MPKNHRLTENATRQKQPESFNWEDPDFLSAVFDLAYEGFYDIEIADELQVNRSSFRNAREAHPVLEETIKRGRARAAEHGVVDIPSVAKFRRTWAKCDGKRTKLMEFFKVGWTTLQNWFLQEPQFVDIMAERDLKFLEQTDVAGRILALGAVKGKDSFPGWERHPDTWMMRWYLNTLGRKYGYGENPVMPELENASIGEVQDGIDIEEWIMQEMTAKRNLEEMQQKQQQGDSASEPETESDSQGGGESGKEAADDTES